MEKTEERVAMSRGMLRGTLMHVEGKSVYLSGPMTGIKDWNKPAFDEAEKLVKSCWATSVYNPCTYAEAMSGLSHEMCLRISIFNLCATRSWAPADALAVYDVLVSIPGWQQSKGAQLERLVAGYVGIEVCNLDEVVE